MKHLFIWTILCAVLIFLSCIRYTGSVESDEEPSKDGAYIFGTFTMGTYYKKSVVAVLKNMETGKTRCIMFSGHPGKPEPTGSSLIAVEEGTYRFTEFFTCPAVRSLFTIEKLDCTPRRSIPPDVHHFFAQPFSVKRGSITVVGTFEGRSYGKDGGKDIAWDMDFAMESAQSAQARIRALFPKFSTIPIMPAFQNTQNTIEEK
jgi:hypothetical protein